VIPSFVRIRVAADAQRFKPELARLERDLVVTDEWIASVRSRLAEVGASPAPALEATLKVFEGRNWLLKQQCRLLRAFMAHLEARSHVIG